MSKINADAMYIGTNYHPHDWSESRHIKDLDLMKAAGMNVVRLGHLCWDSFEPMEGVFEFEWMDRVMDLCFQRGIYVFLDIPTRPAPTWLHKKFPSIDITDKNGIRQNSHTRYMEDVGDPHFQRYALRLAEKMALHFKDHPALIAFGLCNELGSGFISYSETARKHFTKWLESKYKTVESINTAWAGKRWSRKVMDFESIDLPIGGDTIGAPERYLDMRRFYSDEITQYLMAFAKTVRKAAPGVAVSTNHWSENPGVGFDYQKSYRSIFDFSGQGFYPGINPESEEGILGACFYIDHRSGEMSAPNWNLEFQTGSFGGYRCPKKALRMYAYLTYVHGAQSICAWTWRSMLSGEEQYLFGLLDHDGEPSSKYNEFKQISKEATQLEEKKLFPIIRKPKIAIAFSYESMIVSAYGKDYYTVPYMNQVMSAYTAISHINADCSIVDLRDLENSYDVIIIPGHCIMDENMAETIKSAPAKGATVIMTAFSAKVDEHSSVFETSLPGLLTDVFGIKVRGFDRSVTHVASVNEGCLEKTQLSITREDTKIALDGSELLTKVNYHEYLELTTALEIGSYKGCDNELLTAVSCNSLGDGRAVYTGIPADEELLIALIEKYAPQLIMRGLPEGIVCRDLKGGHRIYINTTGSQIDIPLKGAGILGNTVYDSYLTLPPYEVEIVRL